MAQTASLSKWDNKKEVGKIKEYHMAKRAIVSVYILLSAELVLLTLMVLFISWALHISWIIPLCICWGIMFLIMSIAVPAYFKNSKAVMTDKEIFCVRGAVIRRREHMPMDSVKSVTQVITPMGRFTGLNFIIVNALGSKLLIPFLSKDDCDNAAEFINRMISSR